MNIYTEYLAGFFMISAYIITLTICTPPGGLERFVLAYMWVCWIALLMVMTNVFEKERES